MKNLLKSIFYILLLVALVVIAIDTSPVIRAAPAMTYIGAVPLYDSGWVLTTVGIQTFEHGLEADPTLLFVLVADDEWGSSSVKSPDRNDKNDQGIVGHTVNKLHCNELKIGWQPQGIGFTIDGMKWYQRGSDYARVFIFAANARDGPCRP